MSDLNGQAATALFYLTTLLLCVGEGSSGTVSLPFSLILSFGRFGFNSSGIIPAIDLALEHIGNSSELLPGYKLQYTKVHDSECNRGSSLDAFFEEVLSEPEPVKIALIGCGCSVATEPVAEISHHWNISQIAPASASSTLSDRSRFGHFFRTDPTFELFAPAVLSVLDYYGWKRVAFLTQDENLFNNLFSDFKQLVDSLGTDNPITCCFNTSNITMVNQPFRTDMDPIPAIKDLLVQNGDYRIFFLNSYSGIARKIICEAAKRNLTYPHYVWITHGWYPHRWWTSEVSSNTVNCTDKQLETFLERARVIRMNFLTAPENVNEETVSGITPLQFQELYESKAMENGYLLTAKGPLGYDAVWALALALNRTMEMVENGNISESNCSEVSDGELVPLHHFNYSNGLMGCVIYWNLKQTNFMGVSGQVEFEDDGDRKQTRVRLQQYRRDETSNPLKVVDISYTDRNTHFNLMHKDNENDLSVFPDGVPPDGTPQMIIHTYHVALVAIYYIIASGGIVFGLICLLFNFIFRKKKVIKLTSPNLNYFILAGAFLMYVSVYIDVLRTTDKSAVYVGCIVHAWLYDIGYLLAFGTILAKMWRVYQIFNNPIPRKKALQDWHLILIIVGVVGIGLIGLSLRSGLQPHPPDLVRDNENREGRTPLGVREEYYVWECYEPASGAFYCDLIIFAYLGILQIVGIVLAFQTRKVKISLLNDSMFVAALVYISSLVFLALVLVTFAVRGHINTSAAIFSGGILLLATMFLALTFIPKLINLYRDPQGENIFDKSNPTITAKFETTGSDAVPSFYNPDNATATLQKKICEQEEEIRDKAELVAKLRLELSTFKDLQSGSPNTVE